MENETKKLKKIRLIIKTCIGLSIGCIGLGCAGLFCFVMGWGSLSIGLFTAGTIILMPSTVTGYILSNKEHELEERLNLGINGVTECETKFETEEYKQTKTTNNENIVVSPENIGLQKTNYNRPDLEK